MLNQDKTFWDAQILSAQTQQQHLVLDAVVCINVHADVAGS
jgi:hypothetical protein